MMFNTETGWKYSFKTTQNKTEWWDNGVLPLWITAQRQVQSETLGWLTGMSPLILKHVGWRLEAV